MTQIIKLKLADNPVTWFTLNALLLITCWTFF